MKMETLTSHVKEVFLDGKEINASCYQWGNLEGCSFMVHGSEAGSPIRMAGSFRWEELDVLITALAAIRGV